ncbi:Gag-like protein [Ephemerocybe angulata]|uniref:Gag-like protein n=1 Tax=Ephemerocybe angulata TaxID=980116 RepID=A0A8H6LU08_9AGAR|nr:Gag-like protein [Tulosesus angulatus]
MLAGAVAYGGWSLTLTEVPSQVEVDHIRGYLHRKLPDAVAWVGLPSSKSFLRLPNVPFILDAKSNLRIKPEDIARAFEASPLRSDLVLAGPPRVVRNSKSSTRCDVFFDIWDSQQGLRAQRLIKKELLIYGQKCVIQAARASPGTPLCQTCWKWGHPTKACQGRLRCPICGGPHSQNEHRHQCGGCKGNAKANPPVLPTPPGAECPHSWKCLACRRDGHRVFDRKCPFWDHRFDRAWAVAKYSEVRAHQQRGRSSTHTLPYV